MIKGKNSDISKMLNFNRLIKLQKHYLLIEAAS